MILAASREHSLSSNTRAVSDAPPCFRHVLPFHRVLLRFRAAVSDADCAPSSQARVVAVRTFFAVEGAELPRAQTDGGG
jgi:hypothetical protein